MDPPPPCCGQVWFNFLDEIQMIFRHFEILAKTNILKSILPRDMSTFSSDVAILSVSCSRGTRCRPNRRLRFRKSKWRVIK
jgi:hypothetical protein